MKFEVAWRTDTTDVLADGRRNDDLFNMLPLLRLAVGCFVGSIPKDLGRLNKLESLLLGDNKLTGDGVEVCMV